LFAKWRRNLVCFFLKRSGFGNFSPCPWFREDRSPVVTTAPKNPHQVCFSSAAGKGLPTSWISWRGSSLVVSLSFFSYRWPSDIATWFSFQRPSWLSCPLYINLGALGLMRRFFFLPPSSIGIFRVGPLRRVCVFKVPTLRVLAPQGSFVSKTRYLPEELKGVDPAICQSGKVEETVGSPTQ